MRDRLYDQLAVGEASYWWGHGQADLQGRLLRRYQPDPRGTSLIVGCGTGGNLTTLARAGFTEIVGIDRSELALTRTRSQHPNARIARSDAAMLPFGDGAFRTTMMFGVLYHQWVADPAQVLREIARVTRAGGLIFATDPAFQFLRRQKDDLVMGARRFDKEAYRALAKEAGLEIEFCSYHLMSFLLPTTLVAFFDRFRRRPISDESWEQAKLPGYLDGIFRWVHLAENWLLDRGINAPFGVQIFGVFRKPP